MTRFPDDERKRLLHMPHLGPVVLQRLEAAGIASIAHLQRVGVEAAVQAVCEQVQATVWRNRRRALERALRGLT